LETGFSAHRAASINYQDDPDLLKPTMEPIYIDQGVRNVSGPGEYHSVPAGIFHETCIAHNEFVSTILLTSGPKKIPVVVLDTMLDRPEPHQRPILNFEEKTRVLMELKDRLAE
jgi:hypothetical protein